MHVYSVSSDETKILTAESEITKFYRGKFYCIIADYKMLHIIIFFKICKHVN